MPVNSCSDRPAATIAVAFSDHMYASCAAQRYGLLSYRWNRCIRPCWKKNANVAKRKLSEWIATRAVRPLAELLRIVVQHLGVDLAGRADLRFIGHFRPRKAGRHFIAHF